MMLYRIEEVAKKRGFSMAQVSFLWVSNKNRTYPFSHPFRNVQNLTHPHLIFHVTQIAVAAPIIGATKLKNLDELIGK